MIRDADMMATHTIVVGIQSACSIVEFKLFDNSLPGNTSGVGIRSIIWKRGGRMFYNIYNKNISNFSIMEIGSICNFIEESIM